MTKKNRRKTEKPPPVEKLIKPGIGIILAFVGYYFMKGISTGIYRIDVGDELTLREVFFGEGEGKNYAVLCNSLSKVNVNNNSILISSVFQDALAEGIPAEFVLMDCDHVLPSGKSVSQRFQLDMKIRPTIFVSGKVGIPKQVPEKHLRTGRMFAKLLRSMLEPHATKIEHTKDLKSKCLNNAMCGLVLKGGRPETYIKTAMKKLLVAFPHVQFASVESNVLLLSNLEEHISEFKKGEHRFVLFKKVSGGLDEKDGRLITSIIPLENDSFSFNSIRNLIHIAMDGSQVLQKLPVLPHIKTRTKKNEEQERKKRERTQARKHHDKQTKRETPLESFQANYREGYRKENPEYRGNTLEEIASMERRKRDWMENEATKHNIAAEDASPEGNPAVDYFMGDIRERENEEYADGEDGEILDLD